MTPDHINGVFEALGAVLVFIDVLALRRDRVIAGVHWGPRFFFMGWGLWNLYYYPQLDQYWSFLGGCLLVIANAMWLVLLATYRVPTRARGAAPGLRVKNAYLDYE